MSYIRAFLLAVISFVVCSSLLQEWSPPSGYVYIEGTVRTWPRSYFILDTSIGSFAVAGEAKAGQVVRVTGRLSKLEGSFRLWVRGEGLLGWVYPDSVKVLDQHPRLFSILRESLSYLLPPISQAMLLGDRSMVSDVAIFDATGTSHLLAASGLHLSIICGLVYLVTKKRWPLLFVVVAYLILTGFRLSMLRAGIMVSLTLVPLPLNRYDRFLIALAVILVLWPHSVFSVSLWLSFSATLSIILIFPLLARLKGWSKYPLGTLLTTTTAQLATLPIVLYSFGRAAFPVGIITNLLAIPLATALLASSLICIFVPHPLSYPFVQFNILVEQLLVSWLRVFAP